MSHLLNCLSIQLLHFKIKKMKKQGNIFKKKQIPHLSHYTSIKCFFFFLVEKEIKGEKKAAKAIKKKKK